MKEYLAPSEFINSDHPDVIKFAKETVGEAIDPAEQVKQLFYKIRDLYPYVPFGMDLRREALKASAQLNNKTGYCVPKAMLLTACARSLGIPARICFFIVRNHLGTGKLEAMLNTDLIVFHGSAEVYLNGKWVKLVPAFDKKLCDKLGVSPIEFDGVHDAIFQEYHPKEGGESANQKQFMEYIHEYGSFDDFPYELARTELFKHYPSAFDDSLPMEQRILFKHW